MPLLWYCLVVLCVCLLYICWINIVWGCVWVESNTQSNFRHAIVSWVNAAPINNRLLSTNAHRTWKCTNEVECVLELTWNIMKWHANKNLQEYWIPVKHMEISVIFGLSSVLPGNEYHLIKTYSTSCDETIGKKLHLDGMYSFIKNSHFTLICRKLIRNSGPCL